MGEAGSVYKNTAIKIVDEIPIFSEHDSYIASYDQISCDHLAAITEKSENPWISSDIWDVMEDETVLLAINYLKLGEKSQGKILDVGVGLGRLLSKIKRASKLNIEMYGMDISLNYLKIAKTKNIHVAMAKIEDIPYNDNFFDIITCTDVLEHVFDLNLSINKIINCLKPGGFFIVRVPNREDLSSYLKSDYPYRIAHIRDFNENSVKLLFDRVFNLEVLEVKNGLIIENYSLLKYQLPIKGYIVFIRIFLKILKHFSKNKYKLIVSRLFYPTEINFVMRKPV